MDTVLKVDNISIKLRKRLVKKENAEEKK